MVSKTGLLPKTACIDPVTILLREPGRHLRKMQDRWLIFSERGLAKLRFTPEGFRIHPILSKPCRGSRMLNNPPKPHYRDVTNVQKGGF